MNVSKTLLQTVAVAIAVTVASCRSSNDVVVRSTGSVPAGCVQSGAVVHRVSNITGTVGYRQDSTQLTLSYYVPGTDAKGTLLPIFGGEEMYYLYLTSIKSR